MEPTLRDLATSPPDNDGERSVVLKHYHDIKAARLTGWDWSTIAGTLNRNPRALSAAFHRIDAAIKAGRLDAARMGGKPVRQVNPPAPAARSNFTDLTATPKFGDNHE